MSEYPDDLVKSKFVPEYPSKWGISAQEEKLPFEDEAISLLAKVGPGSWGTGAVAIVSVYLRDASQAGIMAERQRCASIVDESAVEFERQANEATDGLVHDAMLMASDALELAATAIRESGDE